MSLIEALVALAIMSFGMLALVGVQATMRYNGDIARQRTEATRLATVEAEQLRSFTQLAGQPGQAYDPIASRNATGLNMPGGTANASYDLILTVREVEDVLSGNGPTFDAASMKVAEVKVEWDDRARANTKLDAVLDTVVSGVAPALSARLFVPTPTTAPSRRAGRHASIPVSAVDLGNGSSAFKPFDQGTTVWVLDHASGFVRSTCTGVNTAQALITSADLSTCSTVRGRLVTGVVRFDLDPNSPPDSVAPRGPVLPLDRDQPLLFAAGTEVNQTAGSAKCVADNPIDPIDALTRTGIAYACLVFPNDASGWGGRLILKAGSQYGNGGTVTAPLQFGNGHTVCRYTTAAGPFTTNTDHPDTYCKVTSNACTQRVTQNLSNQNFLVVDGGPANCPAGNAIDPLNNTLVNGNTLRHQPSP